nr:type I restriction-modification system subunit M N-terminal domain-containing protein [Clostridium senegalense]
MEKWEELNEEYTDFAEDIDEYFAEKIFWIHENARWSYISEKAKLPEIGSIIDIVLDSIEKENDTLRGVLPKNYSRPELYNRVLGEIVDLFSNINVRGSIAKEKNLLGRVYGYFLGKFPVNEGNVSREFYLQ